MLLATIDHIGGRVAWGLERLGRFTRFSASTGLWCLWGGRSLRLLMPQLYTIGIKSLAVVMLVGLFIGAVMGVEAFDQFVAIGQEARLGGLIHISVVKQIGPVLAAVMIAGRVGGAVSAELGTMRVTEQLDAMRALGADPIAHLVVPRVLACVLMVPMITVFSNATGILGGYLVIVRGFGVDAQAYWQFSADFVGNWDVFVGLFKAVCFGVAIGLISCYKGFYCAPGAAGVGRAATDAFVTSFIVIIVMNFFLAKLFKDLYVLIWGAGGPTAFGS